MQMYNVFMINKLITFVCFCRDYSSFIFTSSPDVDKCAKDESTFFFVKLSDLLKQYLCSVYVCVEEVMRAEGWEEGER